MQGRLRSSRKPIKSSKNAQEKVKSGLKIDLIKSKLFETIHVYLVIGPSLKSERG